MSKWVLKQKLVVRNVKQCIRVKELDAKKPNPGLKSAISAQESLLIDISVKPSSQFSLGVKKVNKS